MIAPDSGSSFSFPKISIVTKIYILIKLQLREVKNIVLSSPLVECVPNSYNFNTQVIPVAHRIDNADI